MGRPVVHASVDDFHQPRAHRHVEGRSGRTVWERSFDHGAMCRELLDPWLRGAGSSYRRRWHDLEADEYVDESVAVVPERGVLVVDCLFAQRSELRHPWDLVVYLDCPDDIRIARMAKRDSRSPDPDSGDQRRYLEAQRIYRALCDPVATADIVVDNTDPEEPLIVAPAMPP
jgi:uridine kinase